MSDTADDLADIRKQIDSEFDKTRMTATLRLRELNPLPPEGLAFVQELAQDPSREVRTLARDILKEQGVDTGTRQEARRELALKSAKGATLLALISLGSAGTGIAITALSLVSYYTQGRFPYPEPVAVLFWVNALLTAPFVIAAIVLFVPSRMVQRLIATLALVSIVGALLASVGLRALYMEYWAFQFPQKVQQAYLEFLSPFRVAVMLLPVILGQTMMLYFLSSRRYGIVLDEGDAVDSPPRET